MFKWGLLLVNLMIVFEPAAYAGIQEDLMHAVERGNLVRVADCLRSGADINYQYKNVCGFTPLHAAVLSGHLTIVARLLSEGANTEIPDVFGEYPIHHALAVQYASNPKNPDLSVRMTELLLQRNANVHVRDKDGDSLLHLLAGSIDGKLATVVLRYGANPLTRNRNGQTPRQLAESMWHEAEFMRILRTAENNR